MTLDMLLFYIVGLGKLYLIPELNDELKLNMKLALNRLRGVENLRAKKLGKLRLRAMKDLAVSDGGFRYFGRDSLYEFFDFYLNQVIALMLMFP